MTVHVPPTLTTSSSAVVVTNLRRAYGNRIVIENLNLRIERGEFDVLLGESGCGKTTLLRALAGLDPIDGGQIAAPRRPAVVFQEHRQAIVASLNEYAKAVTDLGLGTGLHQHTGTCVETRDEVYAVMEAVNTTHLKFAPDVGQLQKGGADAAKVVKDFLPITVHMHLKDFVGGPHFAGYCPLGQGKVALKAILDMMESNPTAHVMVELDGSANQPYTPLETAQISKAYLQKLGYTFRS